MLTARGATILAEDTSNHTALHRAVRGQHEDISTQLIRQLTAAEEKKTLFSAIEQDHLDVAKAVCRHHKNNEVTMAMRNGSWEVLLLYAVGIDDEALVQRLLQKNMGVDGWGPHAQRPLEYAATYGHDAIAQRLLLVENVDVNVSVSRGQF